MVEVIALDEFSEWYEGLDETDAEAVTFYVDLLEQVGVGLGRPYSGTIHGSKYALRELCVQSKGRPLRVFYAFDPKQQAVVLIGGDKTGKDRFYKAYIPKAEHLWEEYLADEFGDQPDKGKRS